MNYYELVNFPNFPNFPFFPFFTLFFSVSPESKSSLIGGYDVNIPLSH